MKVCLRLRAQGTAHTDGKGQEPQAWGTGLVGWDGILAGHQGPLEVAVRRALRGVRVLARDPGVSNRLSRLDLQDRVAVAPVEALKDNVRLVAKPREAAHEGAHPSAAVRGLTDDHPLT